MADQFCLNLLFIFSTRYLLFGSAPRRVKIPNHKYVFATVFQKFFRYVPTIGKKIRLIVKSLTLYVDTLIELFGE